MISMLGFYGVQGVLRDVNFKMITKHIYSIFIGRFGEKEYHYSTYTGGLQYIVLVNILI